MRFLRPWPVLAVLAGLAAAPSRAASWKDAILLHAPMEGTADAARAVGDPKAALVGPAAFDRGRRGQGLSLPAGAGCSYAAEKNFSREAGTLCAWVSLNRDPALWDMQKGSWYQWLFGARDWTADPRQRSDLRIFFDRSLTLQLTTPRPAPKNGMAAVPDLRWAPKSWHHVGVTYRAREVQLHVDGEPREAPLTTCESLGAVTGRLVLGCSDEGGHNALDGVVDEVYILSRPLTADEVKVVYLATGAAAADDSGAALPEPLVSAPLDGTTAARVAKVGTVEAKGMGLEYTDWQRGRALVVRRRSYDLKASCVYAQLPGPPPQRGTCMVWMKPAGAKPWDGNERGVRHPLWSLRSATFRLDLVRSPDQQLVLAISQPTQARATAEVARWAADEAHHLAASWDFAARSLTLSVDGRSVASAALPGAATPGTDASLELWLGADDGDQYKGDSAEAAFHDLRLFGEALAPAQIAAAAAGRETVRLQSVGVAAMTPRGTPPKWADGFLRLSEGVEEYVRPAAVDGGPTAATSEPAGRFRAAAAAKGRTYAFWLRLPARQSTGTIARVASLRFQEPAGSVVNYEDNALSQRLLTAATDGEHLFGGNPSVYRVRADSWHHFALVMAADGVTTAYLDGVAQEQSRSGLLLKGLEEISLPDGAPALAEAIGWGRALSAEEIAALFNYGVEGLNRAAPVKDRERPYWEQSTAYRDRAGGVDRVCLNSLWRFLPADGIEAAPPSAQPWGYSRLPGSFAAVHFFKLYDPTMKLIREESWLDGKWLTRYGQNRYDAGWYERTVSVPAEWKSRRVSVVFDYLAAYVARVYVDGRLRAHFEQTRPGEALLYPPRRVDLSDCTGQTVRLSLQVGWDDPGTCDLLSLGDVWLVGEDGWVDVEGVEPVTKLRPSKTLGLEVLLRNAGDQPQGVSVTATVADKDREALALPAQPVRLAAGARTTVRWERPWPDAHLWSPDDPYLYSLTVQVKSAQGRLLKESRQRLGFREFGINGRDFVLNGRKIHLRGSNCNLPCNYRYTDPEYVRRTYEARKRLGYNLIQYWSDSSVSSMGGLSYTLGPALDLCDELGIIAAVGNVSHLLDVRDEAAYAQDVRDFTRRYGAHASVCLWYVNPNTCWYNYGMHPGNLDCAYEPKEGEPGSAGRALARVGEETVRAQDPQGRPVFTYASGNFGPIYSAMQYLSLGLPIQEEADWPSLWAETAPKPLIPVETDLKWTPHWQDFEAVERSWLDRSPVPVYFVEHSARYLGDSPYLRVDHPPTGLDIHRPEGIQWNNLAAEPYVLEARALAARDILRGWRGYGMSGVTFHAEEDDLFDCWSREGEVFPERTPAELQTPGPKPELKYQWFPRYYYTDRPSQPYHEAFRRNFSPLLIFIGGATLEPERKVGEFTSKDHAYYAGEEVTKEAVVVNDRTDRDLDGKCEWVVRDTAGKTLESGGGPLKVDSGEIARRPFRFTAPAAKQRTDLALSLKVFDGTEVVGEDSFALQAYPKPAGPPTPEPAALLDTEDGKTAAALQAAGVPFVRVTSASEVPGRRSLIVGQAAMGGKPAAVLVELERSGALGKGLNLLVLAQPPCPLLNLIFEPTYERYVWPRDRAHPVLAGLSPEELANWRGASTLAPAYARPDPDTMGAPHYPGLKWHWGNRGIVSTFPLRKPAYGNFRLLADDGFDLVLSPLLEWLEGRSRVLLCQLDLVDRAGKDPVATELLRRLAAYVATAPAPTWQDSTYMGSEAGRAYLAPHCLIDSAKVPPAGVIVSDGVGVEPRLSAHAEGGGTVVLVNPTEEVLKSLGLRSEERKVWHALPPGGEWPLLAGVSPSDLYWRDERTMPVLADLPAGSRATNPAVTAEIPRGKGRLIVWTANASLWDDRLREYENTRWDPHRAYYAKTANHDKIHRALSLILTNLGVRMRHPNAAVFLGEYAQNSRAINPLYRVELPRWRFRTDPEDRGVAERWQNPEYDDAGWQQLRAPGLWQTQGVTQENPNWRYDDPSLKHPYNGVAWYRVTVTVPETLRGRDLYFDADCVDDYDETYLNGREIGRIGKETPQWWVARRHYRLPPELIRFGAANTLAIRVTDTGGSGGIGGKEAPRIQAPAPAESFSPYLANLSDYDINAFHNW